MSLARYDAVVFDLDGTLIDTEATGRAAFLAAAAGFHLELPPGFYATLVGLGQPERCEVLRSAFGPSFPVTAFFADHAARWAALLPARIPPRAGAEALLRRLRVPKALATSASRRTAMAHLQRSGLAGYFTQTVTRDDVAHGKPAPDAFLQAARRLGMHPARCVAVEDSAHGVAAACDAGMQAIMVTSHAPAALQRRGVAVARDLAAAGLLLTRFSAATAREVQSLPVAQS